VAGRITSPLLRNSQRLSAGDGGERGGEGGKEDEEVKEGETLAVYGAVCSLLAVQAKS
jgi:hypothetical protein